MTELATSTYGATEQTPNRPSLAQGHSFELYDTDEDEEYEYLPLPEVDEDFLDDGAAATANGRKERMFVSCFICGIWLHFGTNVNSYMCLGTTAVYTWNNKNKFERSSLFQYSAESGTVSNDMSYRHVFILLENIPPLFSHKYRATMPKISPLMTVKLTFYGCTHLKHNY